MEYKKLKDQQEDDLDATGDDVESRREKAHSSAGINPLGAVGGSLADRSKWKTKSIVTLALTFLTSSQAILIVWSKRAGKYEYSVTTANFLVETLKCFLSLAALSRIWNREGVTEDNRLRTTFDEVKVYPIPAALYLVKNLLQYYIFAYVDAPGYQILKNFNIISTGILYRIILKRELSEIQWAAFILLCAGCTTAQLNSNSDRVLETPVQGWIMALVMALLSGFAGVYTEAIIKKRPSRNINVQNFWLYIFGMIFNIFAIFVQDFSAVLNKGFFHGYSLITVLMIFNHALSGIAVSMVMKYADNIVKVYSTSVAMLLTAIVSVFLFGFHLSLAFFLGSVVVSVSVYLHSVGKARRIGFSTRVSSSRRSNKYRLPFAPFTGVNHHGQPVLFGCAFIANELHASFVLLFWTWLTAMSGRPPVSVTTDCDTVVGAAIAEVFPNTRHRFCKWHIFKKCQEKLSQVFLEHPTFEADLHKCVNFSESIEEFESYWLAPIERYGLTENEWLQTVYSARGHWVPAYLRDTFFAEMSITRRSDGMNSYFDGYINASTGLNHFFKLYRKAVECRNEKEVIADFDTMNIPLVRRTPSPMENKPLSFT
ncbi:hypothetical protein MLD38_026843 [Melastoma candidum]|uniref:Uncharacterized protein n=1 Tax=Melastoma candidum TaxID=119954 RepID=A0ACB9NZV9_9MYRT|nr:hypothetical protein MLD38_026843 [Melastoma candidum]